MINFLILAVCFFISFIGFGYLVSKLIGFQFNKIISDLGFLGVITAGWLGVFFNLFFPLGYWFPVLIHTTGFIGFFIFYLKNTQPTLVFHWLIGLFLVVIFSFLGTTSGIDFYLAHISGTGVGAPWLEYDMLLYHLQSILWPVQQSAPIGLAHFYGNTSYNSIWHIVGASLFLPQFEWAAVFTLSPIFTTFLFLAAIERISFILTPGNLSPSTSGDKKFLPVCYWICFILLGALSNGVILNTNHFIYGNLGNIVTDYPTAIISFYVIGIALQSLTLRKEGLWLTALIIFGIQSKLSIVPLALLIPLVLKRNDLKKSTLLLFSAMTVPWLIKGILNSGTLLYPIPYTLVSMLPWSLNYETLQTTVNVIRADARIPGLASYDLLDPKNFNLWFPNWLERLSQSIPFQKGVFNFFLGLLLIVITFIFKRKSFYFGWTKISLVLILNLLYWLLTAPNIRFIQGIVGGLSLLILSVGIFHCLTFIKEKYSFLFFKYAFLITLSILSLKGFSAYKKIPSHLDWSYYPRIPQTLTEEKWIEPLSLKAYKTIGEKNDQCVTSPVPCTLYWNNDLKVKKTFLGKLYFYF